MPILETVPNVSLISMVLQLYIERPLCPKPFGIGHTYIRNFLLRMTVIMTSQNIDISSWNTLYILHFVCISVALHQDHEINILIT
jgi:hypothetical protein